MPQPSVYVKNADGYVSRDPSEGEAYRMVEELSTHVDSFVIFERASAPGGLHYVQAAQIDAEHFLIERCRGRLGDRDQAHGWSVDEAHRILWRWISEMVHMSGTRTKAQASGGDSGRLAGD